MAQPQHMQPRLQASDTASHRGCVTACSATSCGLPRALAVLLCADAELAILLLLGCCLTIAGSLAEATLDIYSSAGPLSWSEIDKAAMLSRRPTEDLAAL